MKERWPALMRRDTAAEYCDMSAEQFTRQCPVRAIDQGWRGLRWKRLKLDEWIENLPERRAGSRHDSAADAGADAMGKVSGDAWPGATPEARRSAALGRVG